MQGRVFTIMGSLLWLTSPVGLGIAGPVSDWIGLQAWYLAAGVLCTTIGLAGFFVPVLANIEQNNKQVLDTKSSSLAIPQVVASGE